MSTTNRVSSLIIPVDEYRTTWQRVWPTTDDEMVNEGGGDRTMRKQSLVQSRVQKYNVGNSKQFSNQIGFVNTVNTSRIETRSNIEPCLWVVHNAVQSKSSCSSCSPLSTVSTTPIYESKCFIQPSANR